MSIALRAIFRILVPSFAIWHYSNGVDTSMSASTISREHLNKQIGRLPRFPLGHWPTPLERLDRFSAALGGPTVWIKRDDCSGLAFGGNKTRHNEFLLADALRKEADLLVWGAGVQSNNCRQTAAACAKAKLDWFRQDIELPHGVPSHDTFGRVFARLDTGEFLCVNIPGGHGLPLKN